MHHFDCLTTNNFAGFRPLKECFRDMFVIHCPGRKKRFRAHNLAAVGGGDCEFFLVGSGIPAPKMPAINTAATAAQSS